MKAKFLSVLLALTMVLSLLPTAVLADDEPDVQSATVTVGDNGTYATVQAAIEAASDGAEIVLQSNVTETLTEKGAQYGHHFEKNLTINLNDKVWTIDNSDKLILSLDGAGNKLTVKDGSVYAPNLPATCPIFQASAGTTIELNNVNINTSGSGIIPYGNAAAVTLKNCTLDVGAYGVSTNASESNGSVISKNVVITLDQCIISTKNSTDGDSAAVMINVPGTLNISNCEITGGRQGVIVRSGVATIVSAAALLTM